MIGNDNWWKSHGIGCNSPTTTAGSGADERGSGTEGEEQWEEMGDCLLSYTVIETVHAALFMFLTVINIFINIQSPQQLSMLQLIR